MINNSKIEVSKKILNSIINDPDQLFEAEIFESLLNNLGAKINDKFLSIKFNCLSVYTSISGYIDFKIMWIENNNFSNGDTEKLKIMKQISDKVFNNLNIKPKKDFDLWGVDKTSLGGCSFMGLLAAKNFNGFIRKYDIDEVSFQQGDYKLLFNVLFDDNYSNSIYIDSNNAEKSISVLVKLMKESEEIKQYKIISSTLSTTLLSILGNVKSELSKDFFSFCSHKEIWNNFCLKEVFISKSKTKAFFNYFDLLSKEEAIKLLKSVEVLRKDNNLDIKKYYSRVLPFLKKKENLIDNVVSMTFLIKKIKPTLKQEDVEEFLINLSKISTFTPIMLNTILLNLNIKDLSLESITKISSANDELKPAIEAFLIDNAINSDNKVRKVTI